MMNYIYDDLVSNKVKMLGFKDASPNQSRYLDKLLESEYFVIEPYHENDSIPYEVPIRLPFQKCFFAYPNELDLDAGGFAFLCEQHDFGINAGYQIEVDMFCNWPVENDTAVWDVTPIGSITIDSFNSIDNPVTFGFPIEFVRRLNSELGLEYTKKLQVFIETAIINELISTLKEVTISRDEHIKSQIATKNINKKRIKKGKKPLFKAVQLKVNSQRLARTSSLEGQQRTSPRWHKRKGYFRKNRDGSLRWVKPCEVGDKSNGVLEKNYLLN